MEKLRIDKQDTYKVYEISNNYDFIVLSKPDINTLETEGLIDNEIVNETGPNKFAINKSNPLSYDDDNTKLNITKCIIWGVLDSIYEDWAEIDLGSKNGIMIFDKIIWYKALNIIRLLSCGYLIKTVCYGRLRNENILLLSLNKTNPRNEDEIVFGIVIVINKNYLDMYISSKIRLPVLHSTFETKNLKSLLLNENVKINDVIKLIPINIDYTKNIIHLDLDIEGLRYLKFIDHYEGKIIKGILSKDEDTNIIIILLCDLYGHELYGNINYLIKANKNTNNWISRLHGKQINVYIREYNSINNNLDLALSKIEMQKLYLSKV